MFEERPLLYVNIIILKSISPESTPHLGLVIIFLIAEACFRHLDLDTFRSI